MQDQKPPPDPFQVVWPVGPSEQSIKPKGEPSRRRRRPRSCSLSTSCSGTGARMLDPATALQPGKSRRGRDNQRLRNPAETAEHPLRPDGVRGRRDPGQGGGRNRDGLSTLTRGSADGPDQVAVGAHAGPPPRAGRRRSVRPGRRPGGHRSPGVVRLAVRSDSETSEAPPNAWDVLQVLLDRRTRPGHRDRAQPPDVRRRRRRGRVQRRPLRRWGGVQRRPRDRHGGVRDSRAGRPGTGPLAGQAPGPPGPAPPPGGRDRGHRGGRASLVRWRSRRPGGHPAALQRRPAQCRAGHARDRRRAGSQPDRSAGGPDRPVLRPRHLHRRADPPGLPGREHPVGQGDGHRRDRRRSGPDQHPRVPPSAPGRGPGRQRSRVSPI